MSSASRLLGKFASFCHIEDVSRSNEPQLLSTLEDLVAQAKLGEVSAQKLRSSIKSTSALVEQRAQQLVRLNSELEGNERTLDALLDLHVVEETVIPLKVAICRVKSSVQALDLADATRITTLLEPLFRALPEVENVLMGLEKALRSALVDRFQLEGEVAELRGDLLDALSEVRRSAAGPQRKRDETSGVKAKVGESEGYFSFKPAAFATQCGCFSAPKRMSLDGTAVHAGLPVEPSRISPTNDGSEDSPQLSRHSRRRNNCPHPLPPCENATCVSWDVSPRRRNRLLRYVLSSSSEVAKVQQGLLKQFRRTLEGPEQNDLMCFTF